MRILIVEDEFNLADVLASRLRKENYAVDIACDGEQGLDNIMTSIYDLVILDVMLPKVNGFEILKKIREEKVKIKVIMLTAKTQLEDKLLGFREGANDYITKPFYIEEVVARVNAQLRNDALDIVKDYIVYKDLRLNLKSKDLLCVTTNESINIIRKEFLILELFIRNPEQILSKENIYEKVWGYDNESESNNLEAYLSFIRKKINIIGSNVRIKAIRGLGYKLEVENEDTKE